MMITKHLHYVVELTSIGSTNWCIYLMNWCIYLMNQTGD